MSNLPVNRIEFDITCSLTTTASIIIILSSSLYLIDQHSIFLNVVGLFGCGKRIFVTIDTFLCTVMEVEKEGKTIQTF